MKRHSFRIVSGNSHTRKLGEIKVFFAVNYFVSGLIQVNWEWVDNITTGYVIGVTIKISNVGRGHSKIALLGKRQGVYYWQKVTMEDPHRNLLLAELFVTITNSRFD